MKLKKLTLFGFKSFADKTEIIFDEGVTCVVGPNGCGKSNISDSIRWVLGERSAKMLRGSSMEDVIFNGTEYRKPLNFAEVSLTIDNTDKTLPLDYAEVTITRRLYRSGESEYLINKTACRLKDIQDLILDTGIGTRQYSMIEQGKIDHLLRAEPEERRALIEEAAGIAKFKTKKDEALRKLQKTEDNLLRLNDIVQEVEKNIKYAERQAKKAEKYKIEFDNLKTMEIERVFIGQNTIQEKKSQVLAEQTRVLQQLAELESAHHKLRGEIGALETSVTEIQNRFQIKELGRYQKVGQSEKNEQQIQFISDKKMEVAQQRGELLQEQDHLEETLRRSAEKKTNLEKEQAEVAEQLPQFSVQVEQADQTIAGIESRLQELRKNLETVRTHFFDRSREGAALRNQIERNRAFLEHFSEQKQRFESEQSRLSGLLQSGASSLQNAESEIQSARQDFQAASEEHTRASETEKNLDQAVRSTLQELEKRRIALGELDAKAGVLRGLQMESEQEIAQFESEINTFSGFYSRLSDHFEITPGYETVLSAALNSVRHLLLVKQPESLREMLQSLQSRGKGSETVGFLLAGAASLRQVPESLVQAGFSKLSSFVRTEGEASANLEALLDSVLVCDTFPLNSIGAWHSQAAGWTLISRDGFIGSAQGVITLYQTGRRAEFYAVRRKELQAIESARVSLQMEIAQKTAALENLELEFEAAQEKRQQLLNAKTTSNYRIETLSAGINRLTSERESLLQREKVLLSEFDDWNKRAQEAQSAQVTLGHSLSGIESEEHALQNQLRELEIQSESARKDKEQALVRRREVLSQLEGWKQKETHLREALQMVESHEKLDRERLVFLEEGKKRLADRDLELKQEEQQAIQLRGVFEQELQSLGIEIELIRKEKNEQENLLGQRRSEIESCSNTMKSLQESQHAFEMKIKDFEFEAKSFVERLEQKYRLVFAEIAPPAELPQIDLPALDEKINDLQKRVDTLGTVNLLAIEEYEELKQRFDFMAAQKKDLEDSREQLLEAIRKINRTTKQLFEDTFQNVQRQFGEYYKILFNGGEAKLVLLDELHPLDSGVDIVVRPPGKKLQHISLLSGGEKALTAVALIFALFSIKPSPFCLLDEVDAPLDEANVDRFIRVTNSFIKLSQFIIITHNRKTIAMGNALYGVTMQEAGVSKIVSVRVASDLPDLTPAKKGSQVPV